MKKLKSIEAETPILDKKFFFLKNNQFIQKKNSKSL
jgi:hypothetical protein